MHHSEVRIMNAFIEAKTAAEKWKITVRRVQKLCDEGRIPGACKFGFMWMIPGTADKPPDGRRRIKEGMICAKIENSG